ncbi:MAG: ATP-dependent RNA helicase HrpA [Pirellulaceae bacterium]|nr:ATP-dependent RNA helicase HrpA [Pirellulaceae bacterium]
MGNSERLKRSQDWRRRRQQSLPAVKYADDLPILVRKDEIARAIAEHPVVVVCGETGSGKSTQLPKICLELGRGVAGMIGHTQPRRIAARSIAARLADELGSPLGRDVGFKVRFHDTTRPETYIKLMTDGILLAESQHDQLLKQYDTIILDEAHERSLNIDFLLGYLQRLLPRRPDLRLIITSATIDAQRFSDHFASPAGPAPVIEVSGRAYPVEVRYRPLGERGTSVPSFSPREQPENADDDQEADVHAGVVAAVEELLAEGPGDVLVFLPTEREIRESARRLRGWWNARNRGEPLDILPLYARLSAAEQNRVFQPQARRRIVLATNVAESSLTVPNIRYVVDSGTARISRYAPRSKVQRLPIEAVSRASADQRKGRCGRIGPGICIRLYSEDDYLARDEYTTPEIRRTNLASVILQTKALGLGPIDEFPFLDPPHPEAIRDGYRTLFELGAIDQRRELTELGRQLSRLPTDPRIARMIVAGDQEGCLHEVLIIASALELQDPRERPADRRESADARHAELADEESDFLSLLKLWDFYHHLKQTLSRNQLQKACRQNFLSYNRLREWQDIHLQLLQLAEEHGLRQHARRDDYAAIHRALLAGLLSNVALRGEGNEYQAAGGKSCYLWPGSTVFAKKPQWVMGAELVETSRRYLRTVARIQPHWIEALAPHLVKHSYSEPHWHARGGSVMAWQRVTLFGLTLVNRRRAAYGPVDPEFSREIFIRQGLVPGDLSPRPAFLEHNLQLVRQLEQEAAKTRRRELLVDEYTVANYYFQHLPDDICDAGQLRKWLRTAERTDPRVLHMTRDELLGGDQQETPVEQYPDALQLEHARLPIEYHFEPGTERDGVSLTGPREALVQLPADRLGWLVPGLLEQKIVAMIRALPKSVRRLLVPAPDTARQVLREIQYGQGSFEATVAQALSRIAGQRIDPDSFRGEQLPDYLRMHVQVVDEQGQPLAAGRDLAELRQQLGVTAAEPQLPVSDPQWQRDGITDWDWDELPEKIELARGDLRVTGFPAIVDRGENVSLRLLGSKAEARRQTRRGLRRLFCLKERRDLKTQVEWLPQLDRLELYARGVCDRQALREQLMELIADRALLLARDLPRDRAQYAALLKAGRARTGLATQDVTRVARGIFESLHQARLALEAATPQSWQNAARDAEDQLRRLVTPRFLVDTPWQWLEHYPRYLQAIARRIEKLSSGGLPRDQLAIAELHPLYQQYDDCLQRHRDLGIDDPELELYRWMLEEYRVSLFAQELGTSISVSARRLEKQWAKVQS